MNHICSAERRLTCLNLTNVNAVISHIMMERLLAMNAWSHSLTAGSSHRDTIMGIIVQQNAPMPSPHESLAYLGRGASFQKYDICPIKNTVADVI